MSSLELVKIINDLREYGQAELRHDNFMIKVAKVLGETDVLKFQGIYKDSMNRDKPCYHLPKRESQLMVMSESYKVQAAVYDRMVELEEKQPQQAQLDMFNADQITISKDDYIDLLKIKVSHLEAVKQPTNLTKPRQEKRKWFWTQADIDALNDYVEQGLAYWKIAELTGRSISAVSCAIARYVVKNGAA
jgi:hypothetical protein